MWRLYVYYVLTLSFNRHLLRLPLHTATYVIYWLQKPSFLNKFKVLITHSLPTLNKCPPKSTKEFPTAF